MSNADVYEDGVFDAEDIVDGFGDEEIELDDVEEIEVEEVEVGEVVAEEDADEEDGDIGEGDSEADLAEVLETRIWKVAAKGGAVEDSVMGVETLPTPQQKDEFRCMSCRLIKKKTQLADPDKVLCRDCV